MSLNISSDTIERGRGLNLATVSYGGTIKDFRINSISVIDVY